MEVAGLLDNANRNVSRVCWICRGEFGALSAEEGDQQIASSLTINAARLGTLSIQFWGKQQQLERQQPPILNSNTIDGVLAGLPNPPEHGKPDILLRSLSLLHAKSGKIFTIDTFRQWSLAAARDMDELAFHVRTLVDRGDLKHALVRISRLLVRVGHGSDKCLHRDRTLMLVQY
jgi:hypothetical protein